MKSVMHIDFVRLLNAIVRTGLVGLLLLGPVLCAAPPLPGAGKADRIPTLTGANLQDQFLTFPPQTSKQTQPLQTPTLTLPPTAGDVSHASRFDRLAGIIIPRGDGRTTLISHLLYTETTSSFL
jgi:hypothetical protein